MTSNCKICGQNNCKKHSMLIGKAVNIKEFQGSTPPEIFVGHWNYPNVYTGLLSPQHTGDTEIMSSHEKWQKHKMPIPDIINLRSQLIYARTTSNIKKQSPFLKVMKEVAMTHKSVSTEFKLKKKINPTKHPDPRVPLISKAAPLEKARLQENTKIKPKIDYLVNDTQVKSVIAMQELAKAKIATSSIIKILSAGLLGLKGNRKLVPTRWSITATDDTLSKEKLKKIRLYKEISEIQLFHGEYLGNHYEILLLPEKYSYEIIEISIKNFEIWQDYEGFFPRKKYADNVTGGYYAIRLPLTEYLEKIQRQAHCLVFREIRPEYVAPMGVGILRETAREAFSKQPEKFNTFSEALQQAQSRMHLSIDNFISRSELLKNFGKQKKLIEFF